MKQLRSNSTRAKKTSQLKHVRDDLLNECLQDENPKKDEFMCKIFKKINCRNQSFKTHINIVHKTPTDKTEADYGIFSPGNYGLTEPSMIPHVRVCVCVCVCYH